MNLPTARRPSLVVVIHETLVLAVSSADSRRVFGVGFVHGCLPLSGNTSGGLKFACSCCSRKTNSLVVPEAGFTRALWPFESKTILSPRVAKFLKSSRFGACAIAVPVALHIPSFPCCQLLLNVSTLSTSPTWGLRPMALVAAPMDMLRRRPLVAG